VINDLLQKDLTSHATLTRTLGIDLTYSNNNAVTNADGEWTIVNTKNHAYKSANYNQSKTVNAGHLTKTSKRYTPLTKVSADNEVTIPVLINRKISTNGNITVNSGSSQPPSTLGKTTLVKVKNTYFPKPKKKNKNHWGQPHEGLCN